MLVVKMKEGLILSKEDDRDRISELPENILLHMMNLMDTREAVQTCVLSKRWNNLWKHLTTLLFNSSKFEFDVAVFNNFLSKFLSDRDDSTALLNVDLVFSRPSDFNLFFFSMHLDMLLHRHPIELEQLNRIMEYAVLHNCQRFTINIEFGCEFDIGPAIFYCPSLTFLRISLRPLGPKWNVPESLQLPVLKTLYLHHVCFTASDPNGCVEPFSTCYLLDTLVLQGCSLDEDVKTFCISNSNLSNLNLHDISSGADHPKIVLSTPNLRFLTVKDYCDSYELSSTCNLLFLEEVNIDAYSYYDSLVSLSWLPLVANIKKVVLSMNTIDFILSVLSNPDVSVRIQPPCFVRLESLAVKRIMSLDCFSINRNCRQLTGDLQQLTYRTTSIEPESPSRLLSESDEEVSEKVNRIVQLLLQNSPLI